MNIQALDSNGGYEFCIKPLSRLNYIMSHIMAYLCDIPCQVLFFFVSLHIWFVRCKKNFTDSKKRKHVCNLQLNMNDKPSECICVTMEHCDFGQVIFIVKHQNYWSYFNFISKTFNYKQILKWIQIADIWTIMIKFDTCNDLSE